MNSTWMESRCYSTCNYITEVSSAELLLTPYVNQARWIPQSIHPYANIRRIFFAGVLEVGNGADADADADAYAVWSLVEDRNLLTAF
jgi:hypothetical protein